MLSDSMLHPVEMLLTLLAKFLPHDPFATDGTCIDGQKKNTRRSR